MQTGVSKNSISTSWGGFEFNSTQQINPVQNVASGNYLFDSTSWDSRHQQESLPSHELAKELSTRGGRRISDVTVPTFTAEDWDVEEKCDDWQRDSKIMTQKFKEVTLEEIEFVRQGGDIQQAERRRQFVKKAVCEYNDHCFHIAVQALSLAKQLREKKLDDYLSEIEAIFRGRMLDIQEVKTRMEELRKQENHELEIEIKQRNLVLQEEAQKFQQVLVRAKLLSEENQRQFENMMTMRKQDHLEKFDFAKFDLEKKKVRLDNQVQNKQLDYHRECNLNAQSNTRDIEMRKISSIEHVELAKMNSQDRIASFDRIISLAGQVIPHFASQAQSGRVLNSKVPEIGRGSHLHSTNPAPRVLQASPNPSSLTISSTIDKPSPRPLNAQPKKVEFPIQSPQAMSHQTLSFSGSRRQENPQIPNVHTNHNLQDQPKNQQQNEDVELSFVEKIISNTIDLAPWLIKKNPYGFVLATVAQSLGVGEKSVKFLQYMTSQERVDDLLRAKGITEQDIKDVVNGNKEAQKRVIDLMGPD